MSLTTVVPDSSAVNAWHVGAACGSMACDADCDVRALKHMLFPPLRSLHPLRLQSPFLNE